MKLYLSGLIETTLGWGMNIEDTWDLKNTYILQSFAYAKDEHTQYYTQCKGFVMDSGAFTIMNKKNKNFNIKDFTNKYGNFVKKHNIDDFFELDIDSVFSYDVYKDCLHRLQDITGKEPIRVFHTWRGLDYFTECCKKFNKLAIGGLVIGENKSFLRKNLSFFTQIAKENNCELHGLGVTDSSIIRTSDFYSVDSSSWSSVGRFGTIYKFDGHNPVDYDISRKNCPVGKQLNKQNGLIITAQAWNRYSEYLEQF